MPSRLTRFFLFTFLAATFAPLAVASSTPAADLAGVYDNVGVSVSREASGETVSFQGLVELNFDSGLTRMLHGDIDRFTIRETPRFLRIECRDEAGRITWSRRWEKGVTCTVGADRVDLFFRPPALKDDVYLFTLFPMKEKGVVLIEVQRVNATTLGPSVQRVGSFVFSRRSTD